MDEMKDLLDLAARKKPFDDKHSWSEGSITYLEEIPKEVDELQDVLENDSVSHIEDEAGDILWDYCNLLINLQKEGKIRSAKHVVSRTVSKYKERLDGMDNGQSWNEIKEQQKEALEKEKIQ